MGCGRLGSTFRKYYSQFYDLVLRYDLNPAQKPQEQDISETQRRLNYQPTYSLRNLLQDLACCGLDGPPV
ncbi:MAG: hypothetical protein K8L97_34165 [Anaerolineae bacterium]|nr:hypothetical protein [Anaerolineae bacterium]